MRNLNCYFFHNLSTPILPALKYNFLYLLGVQAVPGRTRVQSKQKDYLNNIYNDTLTYKFHIHFGNSKQPVTT
jgi:hypothetical protein